MSLTEDDVDEEQSKIWTNPILTVAMTFFLGELGDKSQLTAMSLSAEAVYPLVILLGTTVGMLFTSAIGIFIGTKIGDKIPDFAIKLVSSIVFFVFGIEKLFSSIDLSWFKYAIIIFITIEIYFILKQICRELLRKEHKRSDI